MKLRQLLLAGVLSMFAATSPLATAAVPDITFDATGFGVFGASHHSGSFDDYFSFTVPDSGSGIDSSIFASFKFVSTGTGWQLIPNLYFQGFNLYSGSTLVASGLSTVSNPLALDWFNAALTHGGPYSIEVKGYVAPYAHDVGYSGSFQLSMVPEPGEWAMMLAGLGLFGVIARRRKSSSTAAA